MRRRKLARWRHSSHCNGGACIEVTQVAGRIAIRDSGCTDQAVVSCSLAAWQDFVKRIRIDTFDIPVMPSR
jgi:hypothetical protein